MQNVANLQDNFATASTSMSTDDSDYELRSDISQEGHPISFYSRKLTEARCDYAVGEREMLSIVETLNECYAMLIEYRLKIYTDNVNFS
jgi:RNase H-like domain found in reverse transcriptase